MSVKDLKRSCFIHLASELLRTVVMTDAVYGSITYGDSALALAHDISTWLAAHLTWQGLRLLHWRHHAHHLWLLLLHAHHLWLLLHAAHGYTTSLRRDRREHGLGRIGWDLRRLLIFHLLLSVAVLIASRRHGRHGQVLTVHVVGLDEVVRRLLNLLEAAIACVNHLVARLHW